MRFATAALSYGVGGVLGKFAARSASVPDPPFRWRRVHGPWFDNNLATAEVTDSGLRLWWARGEVDGRQDRPSLVMVCDVHIDDVPAPSTRRRRRRPRQPGLDRPSGIGTTQA
jgi:hypothetical protein